MAWLADARIDHARELLEITTEPVENIGRLTGLGAPASVRARFTGISASRPRTIGPCSATTRERAGGFAPHKRADAVRRLDRRWWRCIAALRLEAAPTPACARPAKGFVAGVDDRRGGLGCAQVSASALMPASVAAMFEWCSARRRWRIFDSLSGIASIAGLIPCCARDRCASIV